MSDSYVLGNSPALLTLPQETRDRLDREPWVFALNQFPDSWRLAGWRPTVWIWGDLEAKAQPPMFVDAVAQVQWDVDLTSRLRLVFAGRGGFEDMAKRETDAIGFPVIYYPRGDPSNRNQQPARSLFDAPIYHYGSTLTDACNLAWLLNPGGKIKIFGNEWSTSDHIYESPPLPRLCKERMWHGLSDLKGFGLPLVDCNRHPIPLPADCEIPTGEL